ncbi:MAG: hypothetical protein CM15mP29_0810 [Alphaproteobacteria bacterium]|nr:MAG: hypothetical protein CM15mP29_0810 [Alphaproteobacteria bacterium]
MNSLVKGNTGDWEIVIGIEVHAQIISNSKLFFGSSTSFGADHNTQVSFVGWESLECYLLLIQYVLGQAIKTD